MRFLAQFDTAASAVETARVTEVEPVMPQEFRDGDGYGVRLVHPRTGVPVGVTDPLEYFGKP